MDLENKYTKTFRACCLGFVTQAIAANFPPLLFFTFHKAYGVSFGLLALISACFYITQLIVDLLCARIADKIGYRVCVVSSEIISAVGMIGLAFLPDIFPSPFAGIIVCTVIYAIGSGLIEVLCSPIVEACPFKNKEGIMSLLHSFYCWGAVAVILFSTLFFLAAGVENWRILICLWAVVPLYNVYNFAVCPIETLVENGKSMTQKQLFSKRIFWVLILLMICAGSAEASIAQWASAFAESALHVPKAVGDLAGPCGFAAFMGISRVLYGQFGEKVDLNVFMIISGLLCVLCYLAAALSDIPIVGLAGCMLCGFAVGIMWPGAVSISSSALPLGGTALFAFLALAGDLGASLGPVFVGAASQFANDDLHIGLLAGVIFPIILVISVLIIKTRKKTASD